jgi:hypothetical protein
MNVIPIERIAAKVYLIRDQKVMLDSDLAALYEVTTAALNQAVSRNKDRFPNDFAFQLSKDEVQILISRKPPRVFTQEGVAMLSSVLRSKRAVLVSIAIMRTFVRLREMLATNKDIARKIDQHDHDIAVLYDYVKQLLGPPAAKKKPIGYIWPKEDRD